MSSGLYPNMELVERFTASVSASTLAQKFMAPCDLDVIGVVMNLGTAPGANDGVIVNISVSPTSQLAKVSAYNLWTAANAPAILGTNTLYPGIPATFPTVIENVPYPLNYPFPGASGTAGYTTAQSTTQTTETPVTAPPTLSVFQQNALVAPDNTYTDYNGVTSEPASHIHAADLLSFVITAGGSGVSVGAAANLEIVLYCQKR